MGPVLLILHYDAMKRSSLLSEISICIHLADKYRKRNLCHGLKLAVLSMRGGYLVTKSSCDIFCCVGSLTNSGIYYCKGVRGTQWAQVTVSNHIMGLVI